MAIERSWALISAGANPSILVGKHASSVTRNGAGDYTVTFTEDSVLNNANYGALASVVSADADLDHVDALPSNDLSVRVRTNVNGVLGDVDFAVECIGHRPGNP